MTIVHRHKSGITGIRITFPVLFGLVLAVLFLPDRWALIPMALAGAGLALLILRGNFDLWLSYTPGQPQSVVALNLTFPSKRTIP